MRGGPDQAVLAPSQVKQRARHQFDAWADGYDRSLLNHFLFRPSYIILMEEIARWHAERRRPFRVLDIGCGTGTLATFLTRSPWPAEVVGLDYAANMCAAASAKFAGRPRSRRPHFVNGDSEHLAFEDASFDVISCSNSFHHYPHQRKVVMEMARLLKPGGRLLIVDGFRDCAVGWFVYDVVIARVEGDVHHVPWPTMHEHFVAAGLSGIRRRKFNFLFPAFLTAGDK